MWILKGHLRSASVFVSRSILRMCGVIFNEHFTRCGAQPNLEVMC